MHWLSALCHKKAFKFLVVVYLLCYLGLRWYMLDTYVLPWFDETVMASVAHEFFHTGKFTMRIAYYTAPYQEFLGYGPVFFTICSFFFFLFGFSLTVYRSIVLLSGIGAVLALVWASRPFLDKQWQLLLLLLVLHDPFLSLSMHEGRMDLMAISFSLVSVGFLLRGWSTAFESLRRGSHANTKNNWNFGLSGAFMLLGILTTPRSGFLLLPIGLAFCIMFVKNRKITFQYALIWAAPLTTGYTLWVLYAFGSFTTFFDFYMQLVPVFTKVRDLTLYYPRHQLLLMWATGGAIVWAFFKNKSVLLKPMVVFSFLAMLSFHLIVYDRGPYSVFVIPFYYLLIFSALHKDNGFGSSPADSKLRLKA